MLCLFPKLGSVLPKVWPHIEPHAIRTVKIIVVLFLLVILTSLGSALFFLVRDKGQSDRTVKALTIRIALSLTLFIMLMLGFYFGLIPTQGL
jgi:hypothetical protein